MSLPRFVVLALGLALFAAPASAREVDLGTIVDPAVLAPGDYMWSEAATAGQGPGVEILISLAEQRAYVYRGGELIAATTVSTGKQGKETPVGSFTILQKKAFHRSNLYSNAPMPFMQRLTWDGIAIHAGHLPGVPASHGCIRVPTEFAKRLFALTELGATVTVIDGVAQVADTAVYVSTPLLVADPGKYEADAYNVVTERDRTVPSPGQPLFAPLQPVVQPITSAMRD
jgi:lipoprotein-anchoring transpeptidase ErfK/SrfK